MSTLNELFRQLEVHSAKSEHREVHEQAFEILKSAPHDTRALRLTVVSLINMDRYLEALRVLKQYGAQADPQNTLLLERLYVMYKLNLNEELHKLFTTITSTNNNNKGITHLKAQFLYREGQYTEALALYEHLISSTDSSDPELVDLTINQRAVVADGISSGSLSSAQVAAPSTNDNTDSYDLLFNESAILLARGSHQEAIELLQRAEQLCRAANPDIEEQREEAIPILLQRAFILTSLGQHDEAAEILQQLEDQDIDDELNSVVLSNNLVSSSLRASSSSSSQLASSSVLILKELGFPNKLNEVSPRLSAQQRAVLWKNYYRLAAKSGKRVQVGQKGDLTAQVLSSLTKAGVSLDNENDLKAQAKKSLKYATSSVSISASLAAAQLNVNAGNLDAAAFALELLPLESQLTPGVSGALLSLYDAIGSEKKSTSLFTTVTAAFKDKTLSETEHNFLTAFSLHFITRPSTSTEAKELLTHLNNLTPSPLIQAALDPTIASTHLSPLSSLVSTTAIESLVQESTARLQSQSLTKIHTPKIIKKRTRHARHLPVTYVDSKTPDAERWLPMKDRSYYKPKKGKKKSKDTQGGAADHTTEEALNVNKASSGTASSSNVQKNKKKKGKK